jgi:ubiquinone/menaquinone biosynthesis C-methylase UbiE
MRWPLMTAARRPDARNSLQAVSPPLPRVDEIAATGFQRAAGDYERGRPGYPPEAVERMRREIGIERGQTVVDLAAGTGKLTRLLVQRLPAEVIAVEPIAGMRTELERVLPGVVVLDGTAEQIPLPDGAAHAVFVAQAFHWFRVPEAATEIARVLDAEGALAVVRNQEVESAAAPAATAALALVRELVQNPSMRHRAWRDELEQTGVFEPFQEWTVDNEVTQDIETFRHRIASRSYIGAMDDDRRGQLLDEVQAVLESNGVRPGEPFAVPTVTRVIWARTRRTR